MYPLATMQLTDKLNLKIVKELLTLEVPYGVILSVIKVLEVTQAEMEQEQRHFQTADSVVDIQSFLRP